jgi:hypothetical protein
LFFASFVWFISLLLIHDGERIARLVTATGYDDLGAYRRDRAHSALLQIGFPNDNVRYVTVLQEESA